MFIGGYEEEVSEDRKVRIVKNIKKYVPVRREMPQMCSGHNLYDAQQM